MNLNEIKNNFSKLPTESKKDQLNVQTKELLMIMNQIIAYKEDNYFDYDPNNKMTEDEFLTEEYIQILEAKQKLIDIFR